MSSVCTRLGFYNMCGSKSLLSLYQIIKKTDFPSLADEIAEPHPYMNIKVAAFTVSEKSINTVMLIIQ